MLYNSINFIIVFPILFLLYYAIPVRFQKGRNIYLLLTSYSLYIAYNGVYALVLLLVTVTTYTASIFIERYRRKQQAILLLGGALSVLPLLLFKYSDFILQIMNDLFRLTYLNISLKGLNWIVPIGISFFTFQALSYLFDVSRKKIKAEYDFFSYALFVSFFPSIVAGPISRASYLLPQIKKIRPSFDYANAVTGLRMMLWGMFMKVVIADRLGLYVDKVLPNYVNYSGLACFEVSILYSIQIYADFAGYSLMAIGVGRLLGFDLPENFRRPYLAVSVTDFWHRWHISLSTWLKDYIYITMGGSHCSKLKNYRNILVTFLISGLWHGSNWTFVVWGGIHGICQIIEKALGFHKRESGPIVKWLRITTTFLIINFAWILFKVPSIEDYINIIVRIFDFNLPFIPEPIAMLDILFLLWIIIAEIAKEKGKRNIFFDSRIPAMRFVSYLFIVMMILMAGILNDSNYIYAVF